MKRILSLLTVFVMVFALSVPALAVDMSYNGLTLEEYPLFDTNYLYHVMLYDSEAGRYYVYATDKPLSYGQYNDNGTNLIRFYAKYTDNFVYQYNYYDISKNKWHWETPWTETYSLGGRTYAYFSAIGEAVWSNHDIVDTDNNTVKISATLPEVLKCDGSSCPATDDNSDGICDDCGRVLRLTSTPTSYPTLPVVDGDNQHSVLIKDEVGYKYYVTYSENEYTISGVHSDIFRANMSRVVPYKVYTYQNGDSDWVLNNDSSGSSMMLGMADVVTLISSTFDWVDSETGDLFFPVPLWAEMDQVTQGEMQGMVQNLGGILKVLVPCGVGLMASLVVFVLFGKRSLLFLR